MWCSNISNKYAIVVVIIVVVDLTVGSEGMLYDIISVFK